MVKSIRFPPAAPYLVAAIDFNHDGNVARARRLVTLAAGAGAHAVKFAIRRMPRSVPLGEVDASAIESGPPSDGDFWKRLELPPNGLAAVRREARGKVAFVVAPYDTETLRMSIRLKPDAFQIDPPALVDIPLLRAVARQRKPVLLVAGMCTTSALRAAVRELRGGPLAVLHTVAALPLGRADARLAFIPWLRARFKTPVGYLGWEPGIEWALVAAGLGAEVIEKPVTLDRTLDGPFHASSINATELAALASALRDLNTALAPVFERRVLAEELDILGGTGQCLVAKRRLKQGTRVRLRDLVVQSPMRGLSPRLASWVEGRRLMYDVDAGEPVTFGMVQ